MEERCEESPRQRGKLCKSRALRRNVSPVCTAGQEGWDVCEASGRLGRVCMAVNSEGGAVSGTSS